MPILITKYKTGIDFPPLRSGLTHVEGENTLTFPYKSGDDQTTFSTRPGVHLMLINGGALTLTDDTDTFTVAFGASDIVITWHSQRNSLRDIDDVVVVFNAFAKPTEGMTRLRFTATSGQTVFSGSDVDGTALEFRQGGVLVFQNDNYLETTDYNTNTANTVELNTGATAGDKISIIAFDSVTDNTAVNNAVTNKLPLSGGTMVGNIDLDGNELILDTDGDTSIRATTDDQIDFKVAGSDEVELTANYFRPAANNGSSLGTSVRRWNTVHANTGNFANQLTLGLADGTAPMVVTSTTKVDNLNADLLDGQEGSYYTDYTNTAIANLVASAPSTLDTLNELAAALGDDANFSTTVTNSIATKLPLAGGTMTGAISFASGQTFDGRDVSALADKLDNIEANADVTDTANVVAALSAGTNITISAGGEIASSASLTNAEIKTQYEANSNTNAFTDTLLSKLNSVEDNADVTDTTNVVAALSAGTNITISAGGEIASSAALTNAEIKTQYEANNDTNAFTDTLLSKLNNIEDNADVTDATNVSGAGAAMLTGASFTGDVNFAGDNYNLGWDKSANALEFGDSAEATFGASADLKISHQSVWPYSQISNINSNGLLIRSDTTKIQNNTTEAGTEDMAVFNNGGGVELYHNGSKKFETTSAGTTVTGNISVTGTVDNRDIQTDGSKLDLIEANADVTDAANVASAGALMTSGGTMSGNISFAATQGFDATQLTSGTVPNARLSLAQQLQDIAGLSPTDGNFIVGDGTNFVLESGNTARTSLGLGSAATANTTDFATAAQGTTADAAMPKAGGTFTDDMGFQGTLDTIVFDRSTNEIRFPPNTNARFGNLGEGLSISQGTNTLINGNTSGDLIIANNTDDKDIRLRTDDGSGSITDYILLDGSTGETKLYHYGSEKFKTTASGAEITGTLNGHTIPSGTGTVALTSDVDTAISNLVDSSPSALNTLNELAAALGDDANFSTTVTNSIATKLPLSGGIMSGNLDLDGNELILDADGDSSLITSTDDQLFIKLGGSDRIQTTISNFMPATNNAYGLGNTARRWSTIYGVDANLTGTLNGHTIPTGTGTIALTSDITTGGTIASQDANSVNIDGGAIDGVTIGTNDPVTELQVDQLNFNASTIETLGSGQTIFIKPGGGGRVDLMSHIVMVGDLNTDASITSRGTGDLTLNTNQGTNSGSITIADGANGNISLTPDGTGSVILDGLSYPQSDGSNGHVLTTNGSGTLSFQPASSGSSAADDLTTGDAEVQIATTSGQIIIDNQAQDQDILFKINDGGTTKTPLLIDASGNDVKLQESAGLYMMGGRINIHGNSSGTDDETQIYKSGTKTSIAATGSGNGFEIKTSFNQKAINIEDAGKVELFHANNSKFETTSAGATVTGTLTTGNLTATGSAQVGSGGLTTIGTGSFGEVNVDDLKLSGSTLEGVTGNNNLSIQPAGTGSINLSAATTNVGGGADATIQTSGTAKLTIAPSSFSGSILMEDATNSNIEITPGGTGSVIIDGLAYPQSDGSNGHVLTTNGSGTLSFQSVSGGGGSTAADDITTGDAAVEIATTSGSITIDAQGSNQDISFKGTDSSTDITALTLDMSNKGRATFHGNGVFRGGQLSVLTTNADQTFGSAELLLYCETNTHQVTVKAPTHNALTNAGGSATLTLPDATGTLISDKNVDAGAIVSTGVDHVLVSVGGELKRITAANLGIGGGGGGSYANSDVDTHLNLSSASANEVLSYNGSDYEWVAQSGGGGGGSGITTGKAIAMAMVFG